MIKDDMHNGKCLKEKQNAAFACQRIRLLFCKQIQNPLQCAEADWDELSIMRCQKRYELRVRQLKASWLDRE